MKEVSVDLAKKLATVTLKDEATLSKEAVAAAFKGTQFKVTRFEMAKAEAWLDDQPEDFDPLTLLSGGSVSGGDG